MRHPGSLRAAATRWSQRNRPNRWWSPLTSLLRSPAPSAAPPRNRSPFLFVRRWMFDVRRSAPTHARPQFFARVVRASRVLAKASRLRGLLECNHILTEGAASKSLLSLARDSPPPHLPCFLGSSRNRRKNVRN